MRTLKDELIKKGVVTQTELDGAPKEEFIKGEIAYTRSNGIREISKLLYGKPIKESSFKFKPRHGRTKIMNIKEQMDNRKISRDSFQFMAVSYLLDNTAEWQSVTEVSVAVKWNRASTSSLLTNLRKTGFLYFEGRQGEKGWVYKLKEQYHKCTPEEICMEYLDRIKHIRKTAREKAANELGSKQGGQPHGSDEEPKQGRKASKSTKHWINKTQKLIEEKLKEAGEVFGVKVEVSGNINITFKLG